MTGKRDLTTAVRRRIFLVRGAPVMLSQDLAALYEVAPKALVQAVMRNRTRFPSDFMFQLDEAEWERLKSQIVTSNRGGVRRALPYAFTEQGVAMLSSVLRSRRAIDVNIAIMRAFAGLRSVATANREVLRRLRALERKTDRRFADAFAAIRHLLAASDRTRRRIGFTVE